MRTLAVLGASGHGKVIADIATLNGWSVMFFDDAWPDVILRHWEIQGNTSVLVATLSDFDGVVVAIGHCQTRWRKHQELKRQGACIASLLHPHVSISVSASLGDGTVVMPGAVINVDSSLGESVIVNTGATVDHECVLSDAVHIGPGAHLCGDVQVGFATMVGAGAVVRQGIRIGSGVVIGAGAVVVADIADGDTVVGNPARPRRTPS